MFSLESGWWYKMSVTNSLWVNGYMYGDIPAYNRRNGDPEGGTLRIDHADSAGFGWIPPSLTRTAVYFLPIAVIL